MHQVCGDQPARFARLRQRPPLAWPTLVLLLLCHTVIGAVWYLVLTDNLSLWWGCLINAIAMYFLFSPIHDAIHRAMSLRNGLNDFFMYLILLPIIPLSNGRLLRVMHLQHHRFANDPDKDPDHYTMTAPFKALWIWFLWDFRYLRHYWLNRETLPDCGHPVRDILVVWAIVSVVGWYYPWEVVFLWLVPTRVMAWLIAAIFMWLPHWPHDIRHEDAPWQATHLRRGWEWLWTPLMVWQNYHLVHHLYPTVPFYRYRQLWESRRHWHEEHAPSVVQAFRLVPERLRTPREYSVFPDEQRQ